MQLFIAANTAPGRVRHTNQDRAWAQALNATTGESVGLLVVCDGIGGHLAGESASHWAVESIRRDLSSIFVAPDPHATVVLEPHSSGTAFAATGEASDVAAFTDSVRLAIERANTVVFEYGRHKPAEAQGAGTTVTLALLLDGQAVIANVGDSRTYLLRDHQLRQITRDHSLVAGLVASGQLRPEDVYGHPQRNVIHRSLGQESGLMVDLFQERLLPGDYVLLCSDGLWEMLPDPQMIVDAIETDSSVADACQRLIDQANIAGGQDNIGVALAHWTD